MEIPDRSNIASCFTVRSNILVKRIFDLKSIMHGDSADIVGNVDNIGNVVDNVG